MENRLETERHEVGRHVRRADPALGSWCWTQRSGSKKDLGRNVDNSYWLMRYLSGGVDQEKMEHFRTGCWKLLVSSRGAGLPLLQLPA